MDVCSIGHWLNTESWVIPVVWSHHLGPLQYVAIYLSQIFKGFPVYPLKYRFANRLEWPCYGCTVSIKLYVKVCSNLQGPSDHLALHPAAHGTWKKDRRSHHAWDMDQLGFKETLKQCDQPSSPVPGSLPLTQMNLLGRNIAKHNSIRSSRWAFWQHMFALIFLGGWFKSQEPWHNKPKDIQELAALKPWDHPETARNRNHHALVIVLQHFWEESQRDIFIFIQI